MNKIGKVSELLEFDPATCTVTMKKIEERSPNEIWENPPKNLIVKNPVFNVTRRDFIHGIICGEGIISSHSTIDVMHRKYPWFSSNQAAMLVKALSRYLYVLSISLHTGNKVDHSQIIFLQLYIL